MELSPEQKKERRKRLAASMRFRHEDARRDLWTSIVVNSIPENNAQVGICYADEVVAAYMERYPVPTATDEDEVDILEMMYDTDPGIEIDNEDA